MDMSGYKQACNEKQSTSLQDMMAATRWQITQFISTW